jgi:hypothetical protein
VKPTFRTILVAWVALLFALWFPSLAIAGRPEEAHITALVRDVTLVSPQAETRSAALNDILPDKTTVQTGADSRAEITFPGQAVARLWSDTILSVENGGRDLELGKGVVLLEVPRGVKGKIHAPGVAAAVSGTTVMFEYHSNVFKFLVLEGTGRLYRPRSLGDSLLVEPGQMVFGRPNAALSDPVDFDIERFLKTCRLIFDFPPLRSEILMVAESDKQDRQKSKKTLIDTNLVIFGGGTLVSVVDPGTNAATTVQPNASPSLGRRKGP